MLGIIAAVLAAVLIAVVVWLVRRAPRRPVAPSKVSLAFTPHAQQRMLERHIAPEQVVRVIRSPEHAVPAEYLDLGARGSPRPKDSVRLEGGVDGRVLKVWVPAPWPARGQVLIKSVAWADFEQTVRVPERSVGRVIGRGGANVRRIERETGASISHLGSGTFRMTAEDQRALSRAQRAIMAAARPQPPRRP